jgi:hypothetical protein
MSPQFVDFDADGHLDIVAATFDGSPKVARGTAKGFVQPVHVLDRDGARIVMNQFWNFDSKRWEETNRCDPAGAEHGHLTSAWACDWDGDGDLDLLLGDHDKGQVMVRRNEGTSQQPLFATRNTLVLAAGQALRVPGTVATLRLLDVTGDGREDLVVGSMGDAYGIGVGGAVYVYPDVGKGEARELGAAIVWVEPSRKGTAEPVRPDTGLHMDVVDHDGDGDLDLVVGGYSHWTPPAPKLSAEQEQRVLQLQAELAAVARQSGAIHEAIDKATEGLAEAEREQKFQQLLEARRAELKELGGKRTTLSKELEPMLPGQKRHSFVWLYENITPRK